MKNKVMQKQYRDLKKLENLLNKSKMRNIRNKVVKFLLNTGIGIDYALPFIIAIIMTSQFSLFSKNQPFIIDELPRKISIESIDSTYGIKKANKQDEKNIYYSTSWIMNDSGIYERVLTTYKLNNDTYLNNFESIFKMEKEELEKVLKIKNIKKIYKDKLDTSDELYFKDTLIIVNSYEGDSIIYKTETQKENILNSLLFIILSTTCGNYFRVIDKLLVKNHIRDILKDKKLNILEIDDKNIETIKKVIDLRKENIELLENNNDVGIKRILRK